MRTRGLIIAATLATAVCASATAAPAQANRIIDFEVPALGGEVNDDWYAYEGEPRAKAILPDEFNRRRAYPVLYILSGLNNSYDWYTDPEKGNIAETVEGLNAIVITPEGADGWFANWWNDGELGTPAWEDYYLDQVIPQIEKRFKIRPERRFHALSGGSMGGLGAAYLGGRLPGYFGSVVISSGFVNPQLPPGDAVVAEGVYGPKESVYADGHNPVNLAANLAHTRVFMSNANGDPTPEDTGAESDVVIERQIIKPMSESYAAALREAGVNLTYEVHAGRHDWPNHRRQIAAAIDWGLFKRLKHRPISWTNRTVAQHGKLWRINYRFDNPPDLVVRFVRKRKFVKVSAAGTPVTIKTRGCRFRLKTPGRIRVPKKRCP